MADIKTKNTIKDVKVFDRTADVGTHMRNAAVRIKDAVESADKQVEKTQDTGYSSPSEYASDNVKYSTRDIADRATQGLRKNPIKKASESVNKTRQNLQEVGRQVQNIRNVVSKSATDAPEKEMIKRARQSADKTIKTASKTVKGTVEATQKGIKTAEHTAKVTVKTAEQTAKATQRAAQVATKAAKTAAQVAKAAAKAAIHAAKVAVKVVIATVKAIIAATKALISAIAAGGWIAVVIILIICLIAMLFGSVFGIFFSGEDSGNGYTMPMAIRELNQEYSDELAEIRNSNPHDEVQMSGSRAEWKEVLAVYAVKVNTDPDSAQDIATMDESKLEFLRSVFWDINTITHHTESREVIEVTVEGDGEDFISTETTVTKTILYITVTHKTASEMAEHYHFTDTQKAQLAELLSDDYASLWSAVLYGIRNGSDDIVAVAASQIGNVNGDPYWSWYGFDGYVAWCACFVSWCANECGYIDAGIIPMGGADKILGIKLSKETVHVHRRTTFKDHTNLS